MIRRPVAGQLAHRRLLDHALAGLLRGVKLRLEFLHIRLRIETYVLGVDLVEHGMVFDLAIQDRLGDGRIVHFGVTMTPEADEIDHHVGAELVAIFERHAAGAHHRVGILAVDVKDGNRQALGQIGREAAGIGIGRIGGKSDEVVDDDVHRSADVVAAQVGEVQRLRRDSLPRKGGVAVHENGQHFEFAVAPDARLLGARAAQRHRIDRLQVAGVRHQVDAHLPAIRAGKHAGRADVILHVAAAQHAARIDILESGEDLRRRPAHDVDDDVQAAAMAHRQHRLLRAIVGRGVQDFVQQRNQRGVAFQRIALGSDVAGVDGLLEDVGANQLIENTRTVHRLLLRRFHALLDPLAAARDRECA